MIFMWKMCCIFIQRNRSLHKRKVLEKQTKIVEITNKKMYSKGAGKAKEVIKMTNIHERIKELRIQLHLSQDYVAKFLGINRSTYTQMENGKRKVLADEVAQLSNLFGVSADSLLNDTEMSQPAALFARSFDKLDERDQAEIMNLIRFKEQMKAQRAE